VGVFAEANRGLGDEEHHACGVRCGRGCGRLAVVLRASWSKTASAEGGKGVELPPGGEGGSRLPSFGIEGALFECHELDPGGIAELQRGWKLPHGGLLGRLEESESGILDGPGDAVGVGETRKAEALIHEMVVTPELPELFRGELIPGLSQSANGAGSRGSSAGHSH
jgi:hypothetical protein